MAPNKTVEVEALRETLLTVEDEGRSLEPFLEQACEAWSVDRGGVMVFARSDDGFVLEQTLAHGLDGAAYTEAFNALSAEDRQNALLYDPLAPAPTQRDVALTLDDVRGLGGEFRETITMKQLFPRFGMRDYDQLRVLVCDGERLLASVLFLHASPLQDAHKAALQALVAPLRVRLKLERSLEAGRWSFALLDRLLEGASASTFVVHDSGAIVHANAAGRARLDAEGHDVRARLGEVVTTGSEDWDVLAIASRGTTRLRIVTERRPSRGIEAAIGRAAEHWSLTSREREIVTGLARGAANKDLANALGISVRTAEAHVRAILVKAQVGSRAELVAQLWRFA